MKRLFASSFKCGRSTIEDCERLLMAAAFTSKISTVTCWRSLRAPMEARDVFLSV